MKKTFLMFIVMFFSIHAHAQCNPHPAALRQSLEKATAAVRDAFSRGDAAMVGRLHSPNVVKYFGGNNVLVGRDAVEKGARDWFKQAKVEFVENTVENTCFVGNIAIQAVVFFNQDNAEERRGAIHRKGAVDGCLCTGQEQPNGLVDVARDSARGAAYKAVGFGSLGEV